MKNHWRKLGQLYTPPATGRHQKLASHAANPLPVQVAGDIYRIFYSGRDERNRSSVGAVDIDIKERTIVQDYYEPFFEHGQPGCYYSDGISIGSLYHVNGVCYILFMGWQNPLDQHWRGDIGRLLLTNDLTLKLVDSIPLMSSDLVDPLSLSYPWVQGSSAGGFDMWYGSTLAWDAGNGEMLHAIHHATSKDGESWIKNGLAVPYEIGRAQAFSKPTVLHGESNEYEMWFSYRCGSGKKYRIGYARSVNRLNWILDLPSSGIDVSPSGWDSEMIEYPYVFRHRDQVYMLYNGNGYGLTGFGLALLERE
jgi:hypothetical protein